MLNNIITVHNTCVIGGSEINMQEKDNSWKQGLINKTVTA